mgnify:CR=1 FL=1
MKKLRQAAMFAIVTICATIVCMVGCNSADDAADTSAATLDPADSLVLVMVAEDTSTALELLAANYEVSSHSTTMGVFVKAIDSLEGGGNAFWVFSVNDTMPQVAASLVVLGISASNLAGYRSIGF